MFLLLLLAPVLFAGPVILVANKKGASFEAELLSATEITATVRRSSDKKLFSLQLSTLSPDCVSTIERHRPNLKPPHPEFEAEASIGTRRRPNNSYSRETQDVTATVKITNLDHKLTSPEVSARMVFIGQNQSDKDMYEVLAVRDFTLAPEPRQTLEFELRPFENTYYDGDYFSSSQFAEHKYDGYYLILYTEDNEVIHHHTTNPRFKKALEGDIGILDSFRTIKPDAKLGKNLRPLVNGKQPGGDVISVGE